MKRIVSLILVIAVLAAGTSYAKGSSGDMADVVEISWLVFETPGFTAEMYAGIIEKFNAAHPGIRVKKELYPSSGNRGGYVNTLYATQQLPDVLLGGGSLTGVEGALLPIDDELKALLDPAVVQQYGDQMYTMPTSKQIKPNVFYNKKIFSDSNLSVPKTWDEFVNIAKTLKSRGIVPVVAGGPDKLWLPGVMFTGPMVTIALADYSPQYPEMLRSGELKWTSPVVMDAVNRWKALIDAGYFHEGSMSFTYAQHLDEFLKGNAAMIVNGSWMAVQVDESGLDVGWFALPGKDNAKYYTVDFGNELSIPASTKHPEAAREFIKYFFENKEIYTAFIKADGSLSTTKEPVAYPMGKTQMAMLEATKNLTPVLELASLKGQRKLPTGFGNFIFKSSQNIFFGSPVQKEMDSWESKYRELLAQ